MGDWSQEPEAKAWIADVLDNMVPKMQASSAIVSLVSDGKPDVKFAVETGMAMLLNKPIILAVMPGAEVPPKLRAIADDIIEFDPDDQEGTSRRVVAAMDKIVDDALPLDPKPWLHEQMPRPGTDGKEFVPDPERRADGGLDNALWAPRSGYAQNMETYDL
jgi:hypothetical protein